jgi:hypothetical protein
VRGSFLQYYQAIPIELQLLSATVIDFNDEDIQFNVKNAFYGLRFFSRQPRFQRSYVIQASKALATVVLSVWSPAARRDGA